MLTTIDAMSILRALTELPKYGNSRRHAAGNPADADTESSQSPRPDAWLRHYFAHSRALRCAARGRRLALPRPPPYGGSALDQSAYDDHGTQPPRARVPDHGRRSTSAR